MLISHGSEFNGDVTEIGGNRACDCVSYEKMALILGSVSRTLECSAGSKSQNDKILRETRLPTQYFTIRRNLKQQFVNINAKSDVLQQELLPYVRSHAAV
jgi:hypothetical protein